MNEIQMNWMKLNEKNWIAGICSVRNLKNISEEYPEVREPVVANNATASTVVFIAHGPPNGAATHVLYVGVTFTGNSPYRSEVPAVSSRSLDRHNMFQIAKVQPYVYEKVY